MTFLMPNEFRFLDLQRKVGVIAGGLGTVGLPLSKAFSEQFKTTVVLTRRADADDARVKELKSYNKDIEIIPCDIADEVSCRDVIEKIVKSFGPIDIFVNAACYRPSSKYLNDNVDVWRDSVLMNSLAIYVPARLFAAHMKTNMSGTILNFSSIYAHVSSDRKIYEGTTMGTEPDYPFLKAGITAFSRYMAGQYADSGVRFNTISLGGVFNDQPQSFVQRYSDKTMLGRMAYGDDIVGPVLFLCSEASRYITGQDLIVDGGLTAS
jgi:NAD(P)-dependent dehydrogenase (short-subunit alcohol dehydrogenase family)